MDYSKRAPGDSLSVNVTSNSSAISLTCFAIEFHLNINQKIFIHFSRFYFFFLILQIIISTFAVRE